jgi:hypothetical protein
MKAGESMREGLIRVTGARVIRCSFLLSIMIEKGII